jgi:hypothetical protein
MEPRPTPRADDPSAGGGPSEGPRQSEDRRARYGAAPPPPPPPPPPQPPRSSPDFSGFFLLLDGLRRAAPAELQEGLKSFIREGLLTLRSLIDWYLDRLDRPARKPEVEEIPID